MKGQYLAVETVFTFGLGLMVAIGIIAIFNQYKSSALETAEPSQAELIKSEIIKGMNAMRELDIRGKKGEGSFTVDLPSTLAGSSYQIDLDENLVVSVGGRDYVARLSGFERYRLSGGSSGGDVTIFKNGNNITLRAQ